MLASAAHEKTRAWTHAPPKERDYHCDEDLDDGQVDLVDLDDNGDDLDVAEGG